MTTLAEITAQEITKRLQQFAGDKQIVARTLGISLKTLYNHIHRAGICLTVGILPRELAAEIRAGRLVVLNQGEDYSCTQGRLVKTLRSQWPDLEIHRSPGRLVVKRQCSAS